jgi:Cu(I)/Ag(I) efflux system protein CusF
MKRLAVFSAVLVAVAASASWAQQGGMGGMDMKDHQGMDMGKDKKSGAKKSQAKTHKGTGVVKNVDAAGGKVTIAHGPISSIKWPAMNMTFSVKDKKMLEKLAPEKKVEFQFEQRGSDYVITSIK